MIRCQLGVACRAILGDPTIFPTNPRGCRGRLRESYDVLIMLAGNFPDKEVALDDHTMASFVRAVHGNFVHIAERHKLGLQVLEKSYGVQPLNISPTSG